MSLEDQYDAWVRGLMGGGKYAANEQQAEAASDAVQQMQAQLEALSAAQKRQSAASSALGAVQKAGAATAENVRKMSSELTKSLKQDGLLGGTVAAPSPAPAAHGKADFTGVTDKIKAQVLGQDAFVSALVKAFRRPFVLGTAEDTTRARSVMLLCGPNGTGRHYALKCVVEELAARGILRSASIETLDLALYPGPAQEKLFLQDLYAALQSDAEVLAFEHYEGCAANYLNMLSTLAIDGTLALSSRYVLQRGILVDVGTALAPGAIGELQAGGKYFVFYSNKGEAALADHFGAKFVDAVAGDICRTEAFTPDALAAVAARELNFLAKRTRKQCGLALSMGADVRDLLAAQYGKTSGMQAMRDYCETVYRAIAEYVLDADATPAEGTPAVLTAVDGKLCMAVNGGKAIELLADDGFVVRKQGIGTFVAEKKLHRVVDNQIISFTEMSKMDGHVPSAELITVEWITPDGSIARKLRVDENEKVLRIVRLRKNDDVPVMIEDSYYPKRMEFLLKENLLGSTYEFFHNHGLIPTHSVKTVEICYATPEESQRLGVPEKHALLLQKDEVFDQDNEVLHYSKLLTNPQRYRLTIVT